MNKEWALKILEQVNGRQYYYMESWGMSTIKEALRYLRRVNITKEQWELCENIQNIINRKW